MKNGAFVTWLLLYPISSILSDYFSERWMGRAYSHKVRAMAAMVSIAVYSFVAYLLYEG